MKKSILFFCIIFSIVLSGCASSSSSSNQRQTSTTATHSVKSGNIGKAYTFSSGSYTIGEDIPEGKYDVDLVSGRGNCMAGSMNEIFGDIDDNIHIKHYTNAYLTSGDIKITGDLIVKFTAK